DRRREVEQRMDDELADADDDIEGALPPAAEGRHKARARYAALGGPAGGVELVEQLKAATRDRGDLSLGVGDRAVRRVQRGLQALRDGRELREEHQGVLRRRLLLCGSERRLCALELGLRALELRLRALELGDDALERRLERAQLALVRAQSIGRFPIGGGHLAE